MRLTHLKLENFRNHTSKSYNFSSDHNLIILTGLNGAGKTNLLEAIYILALGKSFRVSGHEDLVEWEKPYLRCTAELLQFQNPVSDSQLADFPLSETSENSETPTEKFSLELFYAREPNAKRNFKKNGVNLKNIEFLGNLIAVLFHPEDLNMLYLEPGLRRRYLDIVLSQCDKRYLVALSRYKKVLKQRNTLLHQIREAQFAGTSAASARLLEDLNAWDQELIEYGSNLIEKRLHFTNFLNENLETFYNSIADDKNRVSLEYESKILKIVTSENSTTAIPSLYADELFNRRTRDIFRAETTAGPHRDDLKFFLNGKNIHTSASRGEFRTLLLALKLAEIEFIKKETKKQPILLLDDVFSELDQKRQDHLLNAVKDCQTIITTTDLQTLEKLPKECLIIEFPMD